MSDNKSASVEPMGDSENLDGVDVSALGLPSLQTGYDIDDQFRSESANPDATALRDAVQNVFDTQNMNVKSVLTNRHVVALVRGRVFSKKHNSGLMDSLCQTLLEMQVSVGGRGRKDMIAMLQSVLRKSDDKDDSLQHAKKMFT